MLDEFRGGEHLLSAFWPSELWALPTQPWTLRHEKMLARALPTFHSFAEIPILEIILVIACKQALLFGRVKRVSRERASERAGEAARGRGNAPRPSLARSREARFACQNRKAMLVIM